jgi:hypothetical protein
MGSRQVSVERAARAAFQRALPSAPGAAGARRGRGWPVRRAEAYQACADAGVGATLTLSLGGKLDTAHSPPLTVTGLVEHLYGPAAGQRGVAIGHTDSRLETERKMVEPAARADRLIAAPGC